MRFDELSLGGPGGDEFRIRFHEQFTVLCGVSAVERDALVTTITGALTGTGEPTVLTGTDHTGRPLELTSGGGRVAARYLDDGAPAPAPVGWFAPDADTLHRLMVIRAEDLTPPTSSEPRDDDPPELVEARATLRELAEELAAVSGERERLDALHAEAAELERRIRAAEGDAARREYARRLAQLERVRAEAAALQSGEHGTETDRHLLTCADDARTLAGRWRDLAEEAAQARQAAAGDDALDDGDLARLVDVPDRPPADLPALVAELTRAGDHVRALEDRLHDVASASLPVPEDPRILSLATLDQAELWSTHERLVAAAADVAREQVAVGGIGAEGERADAIDALEAAHADVDAASAVIEARRVPVVAGSAIVALLGFLAGLGAPVLALGLCAGAVGLAVTGLGTPLRARTAAERREALALEALGVPTYLAFHLRRVDATVDPRTLDRLAFAQTQLGTAQRAWATITVGVGAEGVTADDAAMLRPAVQEYAAALASRAGVVQEVAELRRTLDELAVPDLVRAREAVALAVEAYALASSDVDVLAGPQLLDLVGQQVALGQAARRRRAVIDAEADEEKAANRLDDLLAQLGFSEGSLDARVGALDWAVDRARDREAARAAARPMPEIEADLARLEAEVARLRRPEWTELTPAEVDNTDLSVLVARRDEVLAELGAARPAAADVDRLADRHAAVERRVAALEVQLRGQGADDADLDELHTRLLAALTAAAHVGPHGEPIPVLLDDALARVPAERKWELMDMLGRLAEKTQLLYLTDDAFIGAWARRRADDGAISLLEPVE